MPELPPGYTAEPAPHQGDGATRVLLHGQLINTHVPHPQFTWKNHVKNLWWRHEFGGGNHLVFIRRCHDEFLAELRLLEKLGSIGG